MPAEAKAAAEAAVALLKGKKPTTNGTRPNGKQTEPTLRCRSIWITKANYKRSSRTGFLKKSDVCIGAYKQYCK